MTRLGPSGSHERTGAPRVEDFFDGVRYTNPFLSNRVSEPSEKDIDVAAIHERPFGELVECAEQAWRERTSIGAVVWGEAGIGKSHLLARFCRWADANQRACYVFLHNIQASPERLPRYVLKCVVSQLTRGRTRHFHDTPLYWLVTRLVKGALGSSSEAVRATAVEAHQAYWRVVSELLAANLHAGLDARCVYEVLFRFFVAANSARYRGDDEETARLAVRWLSGDELENEEAGRLGLSKASADSATLPDNQSVESVLLALAELAWHRQQPLVLCFDQVDNLSEEQIRALTQFLHPLLDHARNLLVVTSGVQKKILEFVQQGMILKAAWERIAQDERGIRLDRISHAEARQLVEARLQRFLEPFRAIPQVRALIEKDPLFPLGTAWLEAWFAEAVDVRPRDVINWSRDRWREQQHQLADLGGPAWLEQWDQRNRAEGPGPRAEAKPPRAKELDAEELQRRIDEEVTRKLHEQINRRALQPDTLPPDTANLSGLVEVLLRQMQTSPAQDGAEEAYRLERIARIAPARGSRPIHHLLVRRRGKDGREERLGVTFVATGNAVSTAATLRRIVEDPEPADRVVLVWEERQPLRLGARGREYLEMLEARGPARFQCVQLTFQQYAALDALQSVVGDARSGDLEIDLGGGRSRPVAEPEVVASHHRCRRYRGHPLLALLVGEFPATRSEPDEAAAPENPPPEADPTPDDELCGFIEGQLALTMGMTTGGLAARYVQARNLPADQLEACHARLCTLARKMHAEGRIHATPHDDQLFLLLR